jgi:hypothetical protein
VCANVLHAQHNLIAQAIAAWPPLALMLTVELISRVPVYRRALAVLRMLATAGIAGIAAYVSYFHMAAVVSRFGEHQPNPYLLPISVDGLIVVASVSLVELAGRVRDAADNHPADHTAEPPARAAPPHQAPGIASAEPLAQLARSNGHRNGHSHPAPPVTLLTSPLQPEQENEPEPQPAPQPVEPPAADHDHDADDQRELDTDPDLAALLPAARAARDTLHRQGRSLTRDCLAAQLRRDGHTIRTSRVSALLNLLKNFEPATIDGRRPPSPT